MFFYVFPSKLLTYIICNLNIKAEYTVLFQGIENISELLPHLADRCINERIYTSEQGSLPEQVKKNNYSQAFPNSSVTKLCWQHVFTNRNVKLTKHFLQGKLFPIKVITNVISPHRNLFTRKRVIGKEWSQQIWGYIYDLKLWTFKRSPINNRRPCIQGTWTLPAKTEKLLHSANDY